MSTTNTKYDQRFYDSVDLTSVNSAKVIVPLVIDLVSPSSVVDVGCGRGAWLSEFGQNGVERLKGYDSNQVDTSRLFVDKSEFEIADLSRPFTLERGFDLAVCIEVAEHLPGAMARPLVAELTKCAPVVLFSAALPGQGGTKHINEQWHGYWHKFFFDSGFVCFDILRQRLYSNSQVSPWFRQNLFLYASQGATKTVELAKRLSNHDPSLVPIAPHILLQYMSVSGLVKAFPGAVWRAIKNRIDGKL